MTARGKAVGDQFEYKLGQPVTIKKNRSAMLPIIHTEISIEKVSLFNRSGSENRPRLAIWLKNISGLTLDAGSFVVIDHHTFAGEGLVKTLQPGESRLLSYALDLGVEITTGQGSQQERIERIVIHRGLLRLHRKVVEERIYTIRNNAEKKRTVVLEHSQRNGWTLVDTPQPVESSANYYRFQVEMAGKTTVKFKVREENPQQTTYRLVNVTPEQIALWVRERSINSPIEEVLRRIVDRKNRVNELKQKIESLERAQKEIFRDQERVSQNLNRLGRTPEEAQLRQRYIRQLDEQEDRLGQLRTERDGLETAFNVAQRELDEMLQKLSFNHG